MTLIAPTPSGQWSPDGQGYDYKTAIDAITAHLGISLLGSVAVAADVLPIPVTHRQVQKTTGADGEALTLANGTPGQRLTVTLAVDGGGDGTLTPATKTGFTSVVFADAGDNATFEYIDDTVGWVIVGTAGVVAPPVIVA